MAALTVEMIQKLKFELFSHPAYSPHLIPSGYSVFGLFKDAVCGHQYANDEVKEVVHTGLCV
jgi:hypothetical protein